MISKSKLEEKRKAIEEKRIIQEEVNDRMVTDFQRTFCPYGYGDIERALKAIEESEYEMGDSNYPPDVLMDLIDDWKSSTGVENLEDIDVVALVYDYIMQHARNEISEETGFDFENDSTASTPIYVAGNYLATSYDRSDDAVEEIQNAMKEKGLTNEDFSKPTQWFLDRINL